MDNVTFPWRRGGARSRGIHVLAVIFCLLSFAGCLKFGMQLDSELERATKLTSLPCGNLAQPADAPAIYSGHISGPAGRVTPTGRPAAIYHATVAWEEGSGKSKFTRTCVSSGADKTLLTGDATVALHATTHALEGARVTESRDELERSRLKPECAEALDNPGATYRETYLEPDDVVTLVACKSRFGVGAASLGSCSGIDAYIASGSVGVQRSAQIDGARYAIARMLLGPAAVVAALLLLARGRRGFLEPERARR